LIPLEDIDRMFGDHYDKIGKPGRDQTGQPTFETLVDFWDRVVQPQLNALEAMEAKEPKEGETE
jgi:hypothetical protein